jgi:hypothetical protein
MPIIIKIQRTPADKREVKKVILKARRTLDGKILIPDHPDIDIAIIPDKNKIVAFPKEEMDDEVYETQDRLFKHLVKHGVCDFDSIQGGGVFMSMEAKIPDMKDGDNLQYLIYSLSQFLDDDLPFYKDREEFEKAHEKSLLDPEPDEYTEDPQRFHHDVKGTLRPNMRPYGISTIYRI